jgi:chromate transport protein ChrA
MTFAAATVSAMDGVPAGQAGLAGGVLNSAMEIGPPAGLTLLLSLAAAHSRDVPAGYAFALRAAATAFVVTALAALLRHGTKSRRDGNDRTFHRKGRTRDRRRLRHRPGHRAGVRP